MEIEVAHHHDKNNRNLLGEHGGHADVYRPLGENLDYHDLNEQDPHLIRSYP